MSTGIPAATAGTWLFVPGNRPERFAKAAASGADLLVLDLEDAVPADLKDAAREHVLRWLAAADGPFTVRVNPAGTSAHDADIAGLAELGAVTVMLPKADDPAVVQAVLDRLPEGSSVVALLETALGIHRAVAIATVDGVVRLALGTYDLAAELGFDPDHAAALAGARAGIVLASAIGGLAGPVDGVTGDVSDAARLTSDVTASRSLGFAGKLCIHPAQVGTAAAALAPTPDELAWAARVIAAAEAGEDGVMVVDGRMVDAPVVARATRLLSARPGSSDGERR